MIWNRQILAATVALALMPWSMLRAESQSTTADSQLASADIGPVFTDGTPRADYEPMFLTRGQTGNQTELAVRFGWWGVSTSGSPTKVGEWQGLDSSAFFDVDGLSSDGRRTVDYHVTGAEASEDTNAGLYLFGPNLSSDIEFQRFIHRVDHDPMAYFGESGDAIGDDSWLVRPVDDLNVGDDYAIRVQKFDARFKGHLTENIKWGLNLWGMRKSGDRQENAFVHRCTGHTCHIQTQAQQIDWQTMEIQPVIEARFGPATVEYSRTMRSFNQGDQDISRGVYGASPARFLDAVGQHPYGQVSDSFTQIDRVKVGVDLTENTQFYGNLFYGDTENQYRKTHRNFDGWDLRLTNQTFDGLNLTAYAKRYNEKGQTPAFHPEDGQFTATNNPSQRVYQPGEAAGVIYPAARNTTKAGVKSRWEPFSDLRGFALTSGYEYKQIERQHVSYEFQWLGSPKPVLTQPTTYSNELQFGTAMKFSRSTDTFVRYKMRSVQDPLYGFTYGQEDDPTPPSVGVLTDAVNSNQPTHEDLIEFGGTWTPASNFMLSTSIGMQKRYQNSNYAQFDEDDYPMTFTAWYAPTSRWTVSGGLGFYSNWIDQDITIGKGHNAEGVDNLPFAYGGRSQVVNLGTSYACTDRLTLSGGYEYVRSNDVFADPSTGAISLAFLSGASDVLVTTNRLTAGIDYLIRDGVSTYFRYNYYDYEDASTSGLSGTANMFLGGITATY